MSAVNPFTDVWNKTEEQAEAIIEEIKQEWVP